MAHSTVASGAQAVITGGVSSLTVMVWVQVELLPQASAGGVNAFKPCTCQAAPRRGRVGAVRHRHRPAAIVVRVDRCIIGCRNLRGALHRGVRRARGDHRRVSSLTVMVWVQVELLPQASLAV
jgi:hypothetical protein